MTNSLTILASDTVPASAAVGNTDFADLTTNPIIATVKQLTVPQSQTWLLADVFITASGNAGLSDPLIYFIKDGTFTLANTPPLSTMLITSNTRPRPFAGRVLAYEPMSQMTQQWVTSVANDTTVESISWMTTVAVVQRSPGPRQ